MLPHGNEAVTTKHTSCSESHEARVSALVDTDPKDVPAPPPDWEALALQAGSVYVKSFESYVGTPYVLSFSDVTRLLPTESSWGEGDRRIVCLVNAVDAQPLMSSVKDSRL